MAGRLDFALVLPQSSAGRSHVEPPPCYGQDSHLGETPRVDVEDMEDHLAFVAMFREVSKVLGTRNLTKEYVACRYWPLKAGWLVYQGLAAGGTLDRRDSCAELCCLLQSEETS